MLGSVRRAMRKGSNQKSSDIEMNERSLITSETSARTNIVTIPPTCDGMASKLILTVLNLEPKVLARCLFQCCATAFTQGFSGKASGMTPEERQVCRKAVH